MRRFSQTLGRIHRFQHSSLQSYSRKITSLGAMACLDDKQLNNAGKCVPPTSTNVRHYGENSFRPVEGAYVVDMRSDVLTKPTAEMREAMMHATADDDIFREDKTVLDLEAQMAALFGKEAALFVPSGTMGNLIGVLSHCPNRGTEVLLGDKSHIFMWEQGGMSQIGGLHPRLIPNKPDGTFDLDQLEDSIRPTNDPHQPLTGLIAIENTHNYCGGKIIPMKFLADLKARADKHGLPIHVDGARILNAAVALNVEPKEIMKYADSVSFCFSKGVGAPIGSVLVGSNELIARALRLRKVLGGGWRKPGFLAAAARVAMEHAAERMKRDHEHALTFAREINANSNGIVKIDVDGVHTNIVMVEILKKDVSAVAFCQRLAQVTEEEHAHIGEKTAVKALEFSKTIVRFTIHSSLTTKDVEKAAKKTAHVLREISTASSKSSQGSDKLHGTR